MSKVSNSKEDEKRKLLISRQKNIAAKQKAFIVGTLAELSVEDLVMNGKKHLNAYSEQFKRKKLH